MKTSDRAVSHGRNESLAQVRAMVAQEFPALYHEQPRVFRLALNEAEALAWESGFPQLTFPLLAFEKIRTAAAWHERQRTMRESEPALAFAE